ncbi:hypothetical protein [Bifidobacterium samirii]|uniref:Uncharacterized protein n=1 Tax=Bifidobacterium samirii TaxID=2306974 RepID=A0A430FV35_9BIFI|nr:hypothetical protein [Bifidobacterium samirii]RSX57396.1 hypothetical protein D2E24_0694 [Bifidobacterium samirii]
MGIVLGETLSDDDEPMVVPSIISIPMKFVGIAFVSARLHAWRGAAGRDCR